MKLVNILPIRNEDWCIGGQMSHEDWVALSEQVGKRIYEIEAAWVFIPREDANRMWDGMPTAGSNRRVELTHIAGSALIVLREMGLLK